MKGPFSPVLAALAGSLLLLGARPAHAGDPRDEAAAEVLFQEAQKLVAEGRYDAACPKFAESARLARGIGVMLYLADCYEHQDKTASAWVMFRDAEDMATQRGDKKRAGIAHDRAATLFPQLASLAVSVDAAAKVPGLVIKRDGDVVGEAQIGTAIPIDPGNHSVEATAPGKQPWTQSVLVTAATKPTISVPPLADTPTVVAEAPAAPPGPPPSRPFWDPRTQRIVGLAAGGAGVVGVAVGGIFGALALSKLNSSNASGACTSDNHCTPAGASLRYAAEDRATASTVGFIAGVALLGGGAALYFTAPRDSSGVEVKVTPTVAGAWLTVGRRFD
jgi:hypothetical protein